MEDGSAVERESDGGHVENGGGDGDKDIGQSHL